MNEITHSGLDHPTPISNHENEPYPWSQDNLMKIIPQLRVNLSWQLKLVITKPYLVTLTQKDTTVKP